MSDRNPSPSQTNSNSNEELIQTIHNLLAEVEAAVAGTGVSSEVDAKIEDLRGRLGVISDRFQGYYRNTRKKVIDGAKVADETIRSHPYESLAIALGVGVLLGALIRRRQ